MLLSALFTYSDYISVSDTCFSGFLLIFVHYYIYIQPSKGKHIIDHNYNVIELQQYFWQLQIKKYIHLNKRDSIWKTPHLSVLPQYKDFLVKFQEICICCCSLGRQYLLMADFVLMAGKKEKSVIRIDQNLWNSKIKYHTNKWYLYLWQSS